MNSGSLGNALNLPKKKMFRRGLWLGENILYCSIDGYRGEDKDKDESIGYDVNNDKDES